MTLTGIPSDSRYTFSNEEWRINAQLRLGLPLASYHNQPHAPCPHGCKHPQTKERFKVRYGYHLVTDCRKANQGNKSHKDVEVTDDDTHTSITATKAKPFTDDTQADILLSGITTIDNPAARNLYLDVTSTTPWGSPTRSSSTVLPLGPGEHVPRNDVLTSAKRAEEHKLRK